MYYFIILSLDKDNIHKIQQVFGDRIGYENALITNCYNEALLFLLKEEWSLIFIDFDSFRKPIKLIQDLKLSSIRDKFYIGISSSKKYAYKGIKNGFFDYLLKPIGEIQLQKLRLQFENNAPLHTPENLCLKSYKDFRYVRMTDILFLKADNNTTDFFIQEGTIVTSMSSLGYYESALPDFFCRVHRSFIVNANHITRIDYGKSLCFTKNTEHRIPFSKTFIENIKSINSILNQNSISHLD